MPGIAFPFEAIFARKGNVMKQRIQSRLVVVAGVLTVSLVFAVQLLAFAAGALGLLLVLTLLEGMEGAPGAGEAEAWVRHLRWGGVFQIGRAHV